MVSADHAVKVAAFSNSSIATIPPAEAPIERTGNVWSEVCTVEGFIAIFNIQLLKNDCSSRTKNTSPSWIFVHFIF